MKTILTDTRRKLDAILVLIPVTVILVALGPALYGATPGGAVGQLSSAIAAPSPEAPALLCRGDIDLDGDRDVLLFNPDSRGYRLLEAGSDGDYFDVTAPSGFAHLKASSAGCAMGDVDGDGLVDVFIAGTSSAAPHRLLRNTGNSVFADISASSGVVELALNGADSWSAFVMWDYDLDGDLDIVAEEATASTDTGVTGFVHVLHNDGAGFFGAASRLAGTLEQLAVVQENTWAPQLTIDRTASASSTDYPGPCSGETSVAGTPVYLAADYHGVNPDAAIVNLPATGRFRLGISCVGTAFFVLRVGPSSALCTQRGKCTTAQLMTLTQADFDAVKNIPGEAPFFHVCIKHGFGWYDAINVQASPYLVFANSGSAFFGLVDGHGTMDTFAFTGNNGNFQPVNCSTGGGGGGGGGGGDGGDGCGEIECIEPEAPSQS